MSTPSITVLVPSFRRPQALERCLDALDGQTLLPLQVIVVWQGDDVATRCAAESLRNNLSFPLLVVHSPLVGIVPAENAGLDQATGQIVALTDDDAVPEAEWLSKHVSHYVDPRIGAVGGPYTNFHSDGRPFPTRRPINIGRIRWYGRLVGNMFDHPHEWRTRRKLDVQHLAGGNMSLRRAAFGTFNNTLKPYWQAFEAEACFQVSQNGYRVVFDFSNPVKHFPTSNTYDGRRSGDLNVKIFNGAFNHGFILGKYSPRHLTLLRLFYLLFIGSGHTPGLVGFGLAVHRYGDPKQEFNILRRTMSSHISGWLAGTRSR